MNESNQIVTMNTLGSAVDLAVEILRQSGAIGTNLSDSLGSSPLTDDTLQDMVKTAIRQELKAKGI